MGSNKEIMIENWNNRRIESITESLQSGEGVASFIEKSINEKDAKTILWVLIQENPNLEKRVIEIIEDECPECLQGEYTEDQYEDDEE